MTYDYIVLGAGITGLALLKTLRRKGYNNILGIEAEKEAGGCAGHSMLKACL